MIKKTRFFENRLQKITPHKHKFIDRKVQAQPCKAKTDLFQAY